MTTDEVIKIATPLAIIVAAVIQQMTANAAKKDRKRIKLTLEEETLKVQTRMADLKKTGDAVHILVNSSMSAQLRISAVALRRIADLTKHPDDVTAAALAEKLYHDHESKQKILDDSSARL